jgi:hypothetical protein
MIFLLFLFKMFISLSYVSLRSLLDLYMQYVNRFYKALVVSKVYECQNVLNSQNFEFEFNF